jgi:hypothetical protein
LTEGTVEINSCLLEHHDDISARNGVGTVIHQSSGVLLVSDSLFQNNSNFAFKPQGILLYLGDGQTHFVNTHFINNEAILATTEPGRNPSLLSLFEYTLLPPIHTFSRFRARSHIRQLHFC